MSAERLREAADVLDFRADLSDGWLGPDLPEEWRAFAAWLREAAAEYEAYPLVEDEDPAGVEAALAVADAILGGAS